MNEELAYDTDINQESISEPEVENDKECCDIVVKKVSRKCCAKYWLYSC